MTLQLEFKDKLVLVTGGTSGIGKAIVEAFVKQGALVYFVGTQEEKGKRVSEELGPNAKFLQMDVSDTDAVQKNITTLLEKEGRVDILVNCAGITRDTLLLRMTEDDWDRVIDVNLKSCYNLCKALARPMIKQKSGKIINISSVIGLSGNPGQVNYAASKAGMIGLTKALAKELAGRVEVNCIAPGFIETNMTDALQEKQKQAILDTIPMKRIGKPSEIAHVALFLASDLASYITGQVLTVDGGML